MLRRVATLLAVGVPVLVAACGGDSPLGSGDAPGSDSPATAAGPLESGDADDLSAEPAGSAPNEPPGDRDPLGSGETVTIAFGGDASFEGLEQAVVTNTHGLLAAIAPVLGGADLAIVNLEAALGSGGTRVPKQFAFQVPAEALDALAAANVDAVSMANNHGMDYGLDGLEESLRIKAGHPVSVLGVGADEDEAYAPLITEIRGQRIGVIAANDVFDNSVLAEWTAGPAKPGIASSKAGDRQERLLDEARTTRSEVDTLVVYLHYGVERDTCPTPRQQELAAVLTDAGADIVVGTHAHRLQGMGYLGDAFVAYGLSNFIFKAPSEEGRRSGVLTVAATGRRIDGYDWAPARIVDLVPVPLSGAAAAAERAAMDELRGCTDLSPVPGGPSVGVG